MVHWLDNLREIALIAFCFLSGTVCFVLAVGVVQQWLANRRPEWVYLPDDDEPVKVPEFMYVDFPDGTRRRCPVEFDPVWGMPTTPGLNSPAWEIVNDEADPA